MEGSMAIQHLKHARASRLPAWMKWTVPAFAAAVLIGANSQAVAQEFKKEILPRSGLEEKFAFSPGVITEGGRIIWAAGHIGHVDDNGKSLKGDFEAQTRQTFRNIERTLKRSGASLSDVVKIFVYLIDAKDFRRFAELRREIFQKDFPASTLIVAAGFALPEIMVEVTPIAVVPTKGK
jgi:2-iminobutanoate/2-iminopropanoate deaminase